MAHGRPDFSPTAVDVVLRPEWAAKEGADKNLYGEVSGVDNTAFSTVVGHIVTTGKTLYISHFGIAVVTNTVNVIGMLQNMTTGLRLAVCGGAQGFLVALNKPIKVPSGQQVLLYAMVDTAAEQYVLGHIGGYYL